MYIRTCSFPNITRAYNNYNNYNYNNYNYYNNNLIIIIIYVRASVENPFDPVRTFESTFHVAIL